MATKSKTKTQTESSKLESSTHDPRGLKRICPACHTRFYDFEKRPPVCPACDTPFTLQPTGRPGARGRTAQIDVNDKIGAISALALGIGVNDGGLLPEVEDDETEVLVDDDTPLLPPAEDDLDDGDDDGDDGMGLGIRIIDGEEEI